MLSPWMLKFTSVKLITTLVLLSVASCASTPEKDESDTSTNSVEIASQNPVKEISLDWLEGSWIDDRSFMNKSLIEEWNVTDSTLYCSEYNIVNSDTSLTKTTTINTQEDPITYNVKLQDQNNMNTIVFKLDSYSDDSIKFVNHAHDFPQEIIYKKITSDSINGIAAGYVGNTYRRMIFKYRKF